MILFVDGFDYGDAPHMAGSPTIEPCKYTAFSSGGSPSIVAGAGSPGPGVLNALDFGSNGFRQQTLTRILGTGTSFCVGRAYQAHDSSFTNPGSQMMRFEAGGTTIVNPGGFDDGASTGTVIMVEVMLNGSISVYAGDGTACGTANFPGTLLWNSAGIYVVQLQKWIYVELQVDTSTGTWSLYVNDVLLQTQTGVTLIAGIDRFSLQSFGFESYEVDDLYITDGNRLGPCRVTGVAPVSQSTHEWTPLSGTNLSQVQEFGNRPGVSTPDDGVTYVESSTIGNLDLYGFSEPTCYGLILALAINADASAIVGSPSLDFFVKNRTDLFPVGGSPTLVGGYHIQQVVLEDNPVDSENWTDVDLANVFFGCEMAGATTARVTQFMIEKLVSLRNVPFNCGFGSYSYGS